jgi:hypothetical protein
MQDNTETSPMPRLLFKRNEACQIFGRRVVAAIEPTGIRVGWFKTIELLSEACAQKVSLNAARLKIERVCPQIEATDVVPAETALQSFRASVDALCEWIPQLEGERRAHFCGVSPSWLYKRVGKQFAHLKKPRDIEKAISNWTGFEQAKSKKE